MTYAGFWRREAAALIDSLVLSFPALFVTLVVVVAFKLAAASDVKTAPLMIFLGLPLALYSVYLLYSALLEASAWQATIGKKALGLRVTDAGLQRLTFGRAALRTFAKLLCVPTFGIGFLMCGFTAKKQALQDIVADCLVLRRQ